jgi:GNAT superfamily N-acetyltransferase
MLRSPDAVVSEGASIADGFVVRVAHGAMSAVAVVGRPPSDAIARAVEGTTEMTPVIAQPDNADYVTRSLNESTPALHSTAWHGEPVILHTIKSVPALPRLDPSATIRMISRDDRLEHLPPGLRHEMTHAREIAPVAVALVDGVPVSFCYPVWTTESLWDVSIDTVEEQRRRGLAPHVVRAMIAHMGQQGLEPMWGALESNVVSLRLAARLGFAPVDEVAVVSRGSWAFLTGGFTG